MKMLTINTLTKRPRYGKRITADPPKSYGGLLEPGSIRIEGDGNHMRFAVGEQLMIKVLFKQHRFKGTGFVVYRHEDDCVSEIKLDGMIYKHEKKVRGKWK